MGQDAPQTTIDREKRALAVLIVNRAIVLAGETGVPLAITTQELAAAAAAGQVKQLGSKMAAQCFRELADNIEAGAFDAIGAVPMRH